MHIYSKYMEDAEQRLGQRSAGQGAAMVKGNLSVDHVFTPAASSSITKNLKYFLLSWNS